MKISITTLTENSQMQNKNLFSYICPVFTDIKILFLFFLIITFLFSYSYTSACTIFNCNRDNKILVGNNEDWKYSTDTKIWFVSPTDKSYGRVCFGWNLLFFFRVAQGGMNDQGLFFNWAMCPKSNPPKFSFKKKIPTVSFTENLLAECATVEEAIKWLKQYNMLFFHSHIMLVDRRGNSAVLEWVEKELRIVKGKKDYQVITNFWLSHPEIPCKRYNRVVEMMETRNEISVKYFTSILKKVALYWRTKDGTEHGTIYSNVYDLFKGDIYIYYKRDFENPIKINLETEIQKGNNSFKLRSLFRK